MGEVAMKERKLPKTDRAGSEVFAEPSLCQHPGETSSTVGAQFELGQASKALDISLAKLTPKLPGHHWKHTT